MQKTDFLVDRCSWVSDTADPLMISYHDHEWGRPHHDDRYLFEMLSLETFQAGLSWSTVFNKRAAFEEAFFDFDIKKIAAVSSIDPFLENKKIIRNRLKILAMVTNAAAALKASSLFGSFDNYVWHFSKGEIIDHLVGDYRLVPAKDRFSKEVSEQMKKDGFKFVGPVIVYSFLQAAGVINDHQQNCSFNPDHEAGQPSSR
ncbi:DNA-3-methyladenine glycosylase I [Oenococcus alcoholitolerans]|uniref:DNA-3-methyladenine glycosylase I n=1 Tax=Oenococcus alcoholitolerans TaxID=931074 RepID=A0ABR4XQM5_9LACO|nr:hypothetical protein Q757_05130 [Oenococcus alcoholitolerans]